MALIRVLCDRFTVKGTSILGYGQLIGTQVADWHNVPEADSMSNTCLHNVLKKPGP